MNQKRYEKSRLKVEEEKEEEEIMNWAILVLVASLIIRQSFFDWSSQAFLVIGKSGFPCLFQYSTLSLVHSCARRKKIREWLIGLVVIKLRRNLSCVTCKSHRRPPFSNDEIIRISAETSMDVMWKALPFMLSSIYFRSSRRPFRPLEHDCSENNFSFPLSSCVVLLFLHHTG